MTPDAFDAGSAKGIAELVAGAVQGLSASKVTITDQTGAQLWPTAAAGTIGLLTKQSAEQAYEANGVEDQRDALACLAPAKPRSQSAPTSTPIRRACSRSRTPRRAFRSDEHTKETLANKGGSITGATTVTGVGTSGQGNSNYTTSAPDDLGVDKTVAQTQVSPGTINSSSSR